MARVRLTNSAVLIGASVGFASLAPPQSSLPHVLIETELGDIEIAVDTIRAPCPLSPCPLPPCPPSTPPAPPS